MRAEIERHAIRVQELGRRAEACMRRQVTLGVERLARIRPPATGLRANLERHEAALRAAEGRLRPAALRSEMQRLAIRLIENGDRLTRCVQVGLDKRADALNAVDKLLESLSYETVLERGYALVHRADGGGLVMRHAQASPGLPVSIEFRDGRVSAVMGSTRVAKPKRKASVGQGELF
jgi:exodeoxyribonuclease VII large subunit